MNNQEKILHELLKRHPDVGRLSDAQLRSITADAFGGGTDEQRIAYMLLRHGKLKTISSYEDVEELIDSYTTVLNVEEDMVESVIEICLKAIGKSMPTECASQLAPTGGFSILSVPQMQRRFNQRVKVRSRAEKRQQLDAYPQVPDPPFTFAENLRAFWRGIWNRFILTPVICALMLGLPTYLLSLLFNHFDRSQWNVYLWCVFGVLCLLALYFCITKFIEEDVYHVKELRAENYYREKRLQKIIAEKGLTKQAEDIMHAAYTKARTIKKQATLAYQTSVLERAYQEALEYVMCYFDEDDRWHYIETNDEGEVDLESYSSLYHKYYGDEAFDPLKYESEIFNGFPWDDEAFEEL